MPVDPAAFRDICYGIEERIAIVTVDRREVYHAFRPQTLDDLDDALHRSAETAASTPRRRPKRIRAIARGRM